MTNLPRLFRGFAAAAALFSPVALRAEIRLPAVFSDHMVFQRDAPAWVWGRADKGEPVSVRFGDQTARAVADDEGRWSCRLDAVPPTGGPYELTIQGRENAAPVVLRDVAVGEVWVCSGQSNMEWPLVNARDGQAEVAAADHPQIRLFQVAKRPAADPEGDVTGAWTRCAPGTAGGFSAVGYFFGRELQERLPGNMPIGLINSSWGGTPAETWTPLAALSAEPELAAIVADGQKAAENFVRARVEYGPVYTRWREEMDKLQNAGPSAAFAVKVPPKPPRAVSSNAPASLFNGMIAPLIPHNIRGVIWYQGETNAGRARAYRKLLPTMISAWRRAWGEGDFPFLVVQLANYRNRPPQPADSNWAEMREAQMLTAQTLPHTGIAVTIDVGEVDIHPRDKQTVGHRLALVAERGVYGMKDVVSHGPIFAGAKPGPGGKAMRVTFLPSPSPLASHGPEGKLRGFAVAGADRKFAWADARIEGDAVVVSSPLVPAPVAVRYAWAENPEADLFNAAGLPAGSWRSDDWPESGTLTTTPAP